MIKTLISLPEPMKSKLKAKAIKATIEEDKRVSVSELVRRAVNKSLDVKEDRDGKDTTD